MIDNRQIKNGELVRRAQGLITAAFVIFVIEAVIIIGTMISDIGCRCGSSECFCGAGTMMTIMLAIMPAVISMILAGRGMAARKKLNKQGIEMPMRYGVFGMIALWQVPIVLVVTLIWFLILNATSYAGR